MANITRIKAGQAPAEKQPEKKPSKKPLAKAKPTEPKKLAQPKQAKQPQKAEKRPFILFRPFIAFGRYLRDSWREIRQVRWPSRKATWKMFFAVLIYALFFVVLIVLLDIFFQWLFSLIIK